MSSITQFPFPSGTARPVDFVDLPGNLNARSSVEFRRDSVLGERPDIIDHQLAHAVRDPNGRAYNRTAHLPERRQMMQRWADYLESLREGADIVNIKSAR